MSKRIILKESSLDLLMEMERKRINLQLIDGYFYPTDSNSKEILSRYKIARVPEDSFDIWSPKFVRDGYYLSVNGYTPKAEMEPPKGAPIGGEPKLVKNPCFRCRMKGLCDDDECGMKNYKL